MKKPSKKNQTLGKQMNKLQWKFQYHRLFRSRVINLRTTASINLFIFLCYFTTLIKTEQIIEKTWNFQQILWNTGTNVRQNLNVVASFVFELLAFVFYMYFIFWYSFANFDKNGANHWKVTKLSANNYDYSNIPLSKFQCRSLFCSWVSRLWFF